jgi:hypothetical protein
VSVFVGDEIKFYRIYIYLLLQDGKIHLPIDHFIESYPTAQHPYARKLCDDERVSGHGGLSSNSIYATPNRRLTALR